MPVRLSPAPAITILRARARHARDQAAGGLRAVAVRGTMIFVSHDRMFLRGLGSRVLELGGESGTDRNPRVYPGSYVEYVRGTRRRGYTPSAFSIHPVHVQ